MQTNVDLTGDSDDEEEWICAENLFTVDKKRVSFDNKYVTPAAKAQTLHKKRERTPSLLSIQGRRKLRKMGALKVSFQQMISFLS